MTLRFLGSVAVEPVVEALASLRAPAAVAVLGPATKRLGRGVLMVPVSGLDDVAAAVESVLPGSDRPFLGHLTLGRARDRRGSVVPASATGEPVSGSWAVEEVTLVRSAGGRYDVVGRWPLDA